MTFTEVKTAIKEYCLLTSTEADTRVGKAINRHYKRITSQIGLDTTRFVTRSASMSIGVQTVAFADIEKIDRILDTTDSTAIRLLDEISIHELRSSQPGDGEPSRWATQNTAASAVTVLFDTLPQVAYSLQADGWTALADLSGSDEPVIPESFHDILVWFVIAEELLKKEKDKLAATYMVKAEKLLSDLRFHLADSPTRDTRQASGNSPISSGVSGGGGGNTGGSAYTQTALITFDRDPSAPFAVTDTSAYVPNLFVEGVGNVTTDRLIGRDTAGTGESEQLTVGGGLEFTGSGGIQIAAAGVTYAKIQDVSAASKLLGRGSAAGSGDAEEITLGTNLAMSGTTLNVSAAGATTQLIFNDAGAYAGDAGLTYAKTTDILSLAGKLVVGPNAGISSQVIEINSSSDVGIGIVFGPNPGNTTTEGYIAAYAYTSTGAGTKIGAQAYTWTDTTNATGYAAWNIHTTYMSGGTAFDDFGLVCHGKHGIHIFPPGIDAAYAPGDKVLYVSGKQILYQDASDDDILSFRSSDVAHGVTAQATTDTYGLFMKSQAASGGLLMEGITEATMALRLVGVATTEDTTKSTAGSGTIQFEALLKSGTGVTGPGANANMLVLQHGTAGTRFILDSEGDSHQDVGTAWTNFDDHDDVGLLQLLAAHVTRDTDPLRSTFSEWLTESRDPLERMKLVTFNDDGHHFVNMSRLTMLHTGALRQLGAHVAALESKLKQLEAR